jgi:hypothetical protein
MIGTQEVRDTLKPGAIVQLNPKFDGDMQFHLQVVVRVHSWGCDLSPNGGQATFPVAWQHFELTGGHIVWGADDQPLAPLAAAIKHHP